jgi:hypothetical protein
MRNDLKALGVGLLTTVALSAAVAAAQQDRAPWALGMSPTFSGRIPNWAQGDAMTPAKASSRSSTTPVTARSWR